MGYIAFESFSVLFGEASLHDYGGFLAIYQPHEKGSFSWRVLVEHKTSQRFQS